MTGGWADHHPYPEGPGRWRCLCGRVFTAPDGTAICPDDPGRVKKLAVLRVIHEDRPR